MANPQTEIGLLPCATCGRMVHYGEGWSGYPKGWSHLNEGTGRFDPHEHVNGAWKPCQHANTSICHSFDNIITICDDCGEDVQQEGCPDCREALARGDDEPAMHGSTYDTRGLHVYTLTSLIEG